MAFTVGLKLELLRYTDYKGLTKSKLIAYMFLRMTKASVKTIVHRFPVVAYATSFYISLYETPFLVLFYISHSCYQTRWAQSRSENTLNYIDNINNQIYNNISKTKHISLAGKTEQTIVKQLVTCRTNAAYGDFLTTAGKSHSFTYPGWFHNTFLLISMTTKSLEAFPTLF